MPVILALAAALVFVTLTEGGSKARSARPITSHLGQMLDFVGLGLTEVTVRGQLMTRDGEIYDRLQLTGLRSIWLLDVEAARRRIETLPWVQKASLKRVFPDRLLVEIQERTPRAIWSDGRTAHLIDAAGRLLGPPVPGRFARLPSIFGAGAAPNADAILTATEGLAGLGGKVVVFEWTANRRWTLHLAAGRRILLPATGQALALEQLTRGKPGQRLLDSRFSKLDMRVASQAAIEFLE